MGFLSFLTKNADGIGAVTGGLSALDGLLGISANRSVKKQFEYNSKLMDLQQKYSRENAETAYNRQIELTQMNPLLQTVGMRQAGHNTAMGSGSTAVASVDSAASPSNPSVSAPDYQHSSQQFMQGISQLLNSTFDMQNKKNESRAIKAQADKAEADAKITMSDASVRERYNDLTLSKLANEKTLGDYEVDFTGKYGDKQRKAEADKSFAEAESASSRAQMDHTEAAIHYERIKNELAIQKQNLLKLINENELHPLYKQQLLFQLALLNEQIRIAKESADFNEETHDLKVTRVNIDNVPYTVEDLYKHKDVFLRGYSDVLPKHMSTSDIHSAIDAFVYYRRLGLKDEEIRAIFSAINSTSSHFSKALKFLVTKKP